MANSSTYQYYYRPGYGSSKLLIEIISGVDHADFLTDLFDALKELKPELVTTEDLWMSDKMLYTMNSSLGSFTLSKDIWGFVFITADENQSCIANINVLLTKDNRFKKVEVDFRNYITKG